MNPDEVAAAWHQAASHPRANLYIHPAGRSIDEYEASGQQAARWLIATAATHQTAAHRWLDFGCGNGRILKHLTSQVAVAHGYDTSTTFAAQGRDRGCHIVTDLLDLEPPYDVVYALAVLIHHTHDGGADLLRTIIDLAGPGGLIIFDLAVHTKPKVATGWHDITAWTPDQLDAVLDPLPVEVLQSARHDHPFTWGVDRDQTHILRRL